jgi:hypothetical protein
MVQQSQPKAMKPFPLLATFILLSSPAFCRDFRPEVILENIPAANSSIQQCCVFRTTPGVRYTVESSGDLLNWTAQPEIYGIGHEYVVTMREFTAAPPPDPEAPPPPANSAPSTSATVRMQPASGSAGGTVISWPSLDHGGPVIVWIAGAMDSAWASIPLYAQQFGDWQFFVWHPTESMAPPAANPSLDTRDSALLAALEASLPAMNLEVANSLANARNTPAPAAASSDDHRFWRVKVDPEIDTDADGSPDWAEFEIAARGTGGLVTGVQGDPFNGDSNGDGFPDGDQLDLDGDGTPDAKDPDAADNTAFFPLGPLPRYALFPITNATPPADALQALQINDKGRVLYENGTWCGGKWTALAAPTESVGDPPQPQRPFAMSLNDNDVILGNSFQQVGPYPIETASVRCFWSGPAAGVQLVKSTNAVGNGYAGSLTESIVFHSDLYRPQISNDNRFTASFAYWEPGTDENIGREIAVPAVWTLPASGQSLSTHAPIESSILFHGTGISWGYTVERNEEGGETGERKGQVLTPAPLPELPFIPYNVVSVAGGLMAFPEPDSFRTPQALINGGWRESNPYQGAFDMASDGTAVGRNDSNTTAPIILNGKWTSIEQTVPVESDVFDPPLPWHDSSVSLLDTTPGGWILARRGEFSDYETGVMLPIRAEGYYEKSDGVSITEAAGVDDFSIGSATPGSTVQDRIWIMAPQGGFNKIVKLKAPLDSNTPLNLSASNITFSGQDTATIDGAVSPVTLRASDAVSSGGERLMTLTMGSDDDEVFSISKPIGLKIMKGRTVNVTVYKVTKLYGEHAEEPVAATIMPTEEEIATHLKDIFRPQINAIFNVNLVTVPLEVRWDAPASPGGEPNGNFDIQIGTGDPGEEAAILAEVPPNPAPFDIRVFLVANQAPLGSSIDAYGITNIPGATCWVLGSLSGKNRSKSFLLDTVAHEIGHVLVGEGHPDKDAKPGPAPLPKTKHSLRLMCSGPNSSGSSRLLVKKEWDEAENWLKARPRGDF